MDDKPVAMPKLNVVAIDKLPRLLNSGVVVGTIYGNKSVEVPIRTDDKSTVVRHRCSQRGREHGGHQSPKKATDGSVMVLR
jgi:hypothetical protein